MNKIEGVAVTISRVVKEPCPVRVRGVDGEWHHYTTFYLDTVVTETHENATLYFSKKRD